MLYNDAGELMGLCTSHVDDLPLVGDGSEAGYASSSDSEKRST